MIYKLSGSVVTPIGLSLSETFSSMEKGMSALSLHESYDLLPNPCFISVFDEGVIDSRFEKLPKHSERKYSRFEKLMLLSAYNAVKDSCIDASSEEVVFFLSTTKGNISLLNDDGKIDESVYLWHSAKLLGEYFCNPNKVWTISNACISGVAAQWTAVRVLEMSRKYRYAVIVGCDVLSKFIISGFQSFKALSPNLCRPFDAERCGLNLGEASACMILKKVENEDDIPENEFVFQSAALTNDAHHISGPSRTGEGLHYAILKTMKNINSDDLGFINAHGTATLYNDDMEAFALHRAHLEKLFVNSFKAYLGHTLGTAGILECLLSMESISRGILLACRGYGRSGVPFPINVCEKNTKISKPAFLKLISGFGGCNAAVVWKQNRRENKK